MNKRKLLPDNNIRMEPMEAILDNCIGKNEFIRQKRHYKYKTNNDLVNSLILRNLLPAEMKAYFVKVDRLNYLHEYIKRDIGYTDTPSPIGFSQTITAPHLHAYAIKHMKDYLYEGASILDVGSGSGYLTAVFGYCVGVHKNMGSVVGIDIYDSIVDYSIEKIKTYNPDLLNTEKLKIIKSDGWLGYPLKYNGPLYDAIHVGARADKLPIHLWNQLKPGGMILIPIGSDDPDGSSSLKIFYKPSNCGEYGMCIEKDKLGVRFVPLQKVSDYS